MKEVTAAQVRNSDSNKEEAARWPAVVALFATASLSLALPDRLTAGPNWLPLVIVALMIVPTVASQRAGHLKLNFVLGLSLSAVVTIAMAWSLGKLIAGLPSKSESPTDLLRSAVALWLTNILVFSSWYWRLDAGGPHLRDTRNAHTDGDFLFPQMILPPHFAKGQKAWKPGFVDYLFLAFNTSTAFSPTDVPVLSRWAKILMMIQSSISLGTLAILAARAINIL